MDSAMLVGMLTESPVLSSDGQGDDGLLWHGCPVAARRDRKKEDDEDVDLILCIIFRKPAFYLACHGRKGGRIAVPGRLRPGKWGKENASFPAARLCQKGHISLITGMTFPAVPGKQSQRGSKRNRTNDHGISKIKRPGRRAVWTT